MDFLQNHIEALIFCSPSPIKLADIKACLSEMFNADVPEEDIMGAIQRLDEKYQSEEFAFQLFKAAGGYQFLTKPAYQASISILLKQQSKKRLSTSAMETLSIIAYKQPISKTEIENIRGVNCDYAVQKLVDKGLIEIMGKAETIGRPMLYGTTPKFMEYFGISDLMELPTPKDFTGEVNTIGENPESRDNEVETAFTDDNLKGASIENELEAASGESEVKAVAGETEVEAASRETEAEAASSENEVEEKTGSRENQLGENTESKDPDAQA